MSIGGVNKLANEDRSTEGSEESEFRRKRGEEVHPFLARLEVMVFQGKAE